ncbi:hydrogenase nickel incorporation protein HypB [Paenibacillus sophorae]|uniref:Hydrogenase nickel incorporation protein HypB n=1 Tax=Paenibacillus sophorae TaxID=1333845 RepID=A0A1H8QY66_9BACL|nr:hydrogenase nickel incorporation protein HypB [Paenibacillus sophorae]QWU14871.1 hydrogenase nickel incorporation protein HypB [Paenibacillus sophorae]SEO58818.1 hydrogenase nickel incorporation protein HypB [Paenibacillus sophorae]
MSSIKVVTNILKVNDELTQQNKKLMNEKGLYVINLMSSPGSGKTSILEKVIAKLKDEVKIAVIEGDLYTTKDAERIEAHGVQVVQINTEGGCHLDGQMIRNALSHLNLEETNLLIIENVGNLICPASFELGEDLIITVLSTTEGNDKPQKYPRMFEKSGIVILNKVDLVPYTNFDKDEFHKDIQEINPKAKVIETSCMTGQGIDELCAWLKETISISNPV